MGYLRVVEITWLHSRRWGGALVVTAAAALIANAERHNGPGVVRSVLLALVLPLALAGLALPARVAWRRRVARGPTAIGSTKGGSAAEFKRPKAVIERACARSGWTRASLVGDGHPARAGGCKRSRVAYALEWCAGHDVELIAVDVELDTSTHDGRLGGGPSPRRGAESGRARCTAHGTEAPTSGYSPGIPRQTGRTDRGPMAPQRIVALIGGTR